MFVKNKFELYKKGIILNNMNDEYMKNTNSKRMVIDFLAGMTDEYFVSKYKKLDTK